MPSSSAASNPSRRTTTKVAPTALLGDDLELRRLIEIVDENVAAGLERPHPDLHGLAGGHDLFDPQILVLDLDGLLRVVVRDDEDERLAGLDLDLGGLEGLVRGGQRNLDSLVLGDRVRNRGERGREYHERRQQPLHARPPRWRGGSEVRYT